MLLVATRMCREEFAYRPPVVEFERLRSAYCCWELGSLTNVRMTSSPDDRREAQLRPWSSSILGKPTAQHMHQLLMTPPCRKQWQPSALVLKCDAMPPRTCRRQAITAYLEGAVVAVTVSVIDADLSATSSSSETGALSSPSSVVGCSAAAAGADSTSDCSSRESCAVIPIVTRAHNLQPKKTPPMCLVHADCASALQSMRY